MERVTYLGVWFNKFGNSTDEVTERINKGRNITRALNPVLLYGAEAWDLKKREKDRLLATEMDFLQRSIQKRRFDRIRYSVIRERIEMDRDALDDVQRRQLVWFGNVSRMEDWRLSKKAMELIPP